MLRQLFHQMWFQRRANAWIWCVLVIVGILLWYALDILYNYEVQGSSRSVLTPTGYIRWSSATIGPSRDRKR